jgi:PhoPQ-activated pathogenicity-related protein
MTSLTLVTFAATARADLADYVKRPEPKFSWKLKNKTETGIGTVYDIHLVSQEWQGILWDHQLQIYQPKDAKPSATLFLWNQGGSASVQNQFFGMQVATRLGAPVAFLYGIPKQPLFDGKKEDALIAETFVRYLDTQDNSWPLLFPMVKSLVKAMDALQAFGKEEWHIDIKNFVVSGASKRGWTTWLTGASDPRVKAIAPLVIDTLNMGPQNEHQLKCFGGYSEQIADYTSRGLIPMPNTPQAKKLWSMVDPYFCRDKLTMPKFIINGNNDPYWTVDALNFYWDALQGDKWVLYVPNAGHNLQQEMDDGRKDLSRALNGLCAFGKHQLANKTMPELSWKHDDADGRCRLSVKASPAPLAARLWIADAKTRDFRQSKWKEQAIDPNSSGIVGTVSPPSDGFRTFYAELDYEIDGLKYQLSTQVRVTGKEK